MGSSRSARCCRPPRRPTTTMSPSALIPPGSGKTGCSLEGRGPACVRGELPRLRRSQGLAPIAARGLRCRPLHGCTFDESHGSRRRHPRQADPNDDERQGGALPITSIASSMPQRRTCCGSPTSPMSRPERASSTWPSSSTPLREGSSVAGEPDGACKLRSGRSGTGSTRSTADPSRRAPTPQR